MVISHWAYWVRQNRVWLSSLAAAAAINLGFLGLASVAPMGHLATLDKPPIESPVQILIRRAVPPPPDLDASGLAESPPSAMLPRFRPRPVRLQTAPGLGRDLAAPPARLRLNLTTCPLDDPDSLGRPDCAPPQEWRRTDRDASELLGPETQGYTLDEVAVARGWIKAKPRTGQDAMAAKTDATLPESIFKDPPFPPDAIERSGGW